jgi:hypothetical protein
LKHAQSNMLGVAGGVSDCVRLGMQLEPSRVGAMPINILVRTSQATSSQDLHGVAAGLAVYQIK